MCHLLALPAELHGEIIGLLPPGDVLTLLRVCRVLRGEASHPRHGRRLVRSLYPSMRTDDLADTHAILRRLMFATARPSCHERLVPVILHRDSGDVIVTLCAFPDGRHALVQTVAEVILYELDPPRRLDAIPVDAPHERMTIDTSPSAQHMRFLLQCVRPMLCAGPPLTL